MGLLQFATVGDQIVFHFKQKNHTVTQSSLQAPCSAKEGGFNSGFQPVPANQTDMFPTYTITVNDTQPIWVRQKLLSFCAYVSLADPLPLGLLRSGCEDCQHALRKGHDLQRQLWS